MPLMLDANVDDAKKNVLDLVGDISDVEIFGNKVLVAIYQRSEKTAGGIFMPQTVREEDKYQGKVGLVLKLGPIAFQDDEKVTFHGKAAVGDWVIFRTADSWPLALNNDKAWCRMIDDVDIRATVKRPDKVW